MKPGKVRAIAICIIQHAGRLLVAEGFDEVKKSKFYRPLGGKIEFGERGAETIAREFMEEIDARVTDIRYLGTVENIFTYDGQMGHEIVLVYAGSLADAVLYEQPGLAAHEDDGSAFRAVWMPLDDFRNGRAVVYPDGVLELV